MKLWVKILISIILGISTGIILGPKAEYFKPVGDIFLNLINMIIVLLVLSSMTVGIASIQDPKKLGRVGLKTFAVYLSTTVISIVLGILFAKLLNLGGGLDLQVVSDQVINVRTETKSIGEILRSIIPSNPVAALAEGNILQIIVFSVLLSVAINFSGDKGKPVLDFLESLAEVMYSLTSIVMEFSPIGVFAIMAWVAGSFGSEVLVSLIKFLMTYYMACFVHLFVVFCGILWAIKLNPWPFFKGMRDAIMVAFSTCSSSAALPVSMHCVQKNLGVSKNITNFVLPLGSTINMNGAALFQGMSVIFVAHAYGISLDLTSLLTIVVMGTLSSVGAAGIPGSGFIMLSMVFISVGLPVEGVGLLAGIDRLREMASASVNVLGDAVCAVYVAKQEGELNERQYNNEVLVKLEESPET